MSKQQLIVIFSAPDIDKVLSIIEKAAKPGPKYNSPKGQLPIVLSVKTNAEDMFEALHMTKADYIMAPIDMKADNVYSMGEIARALFYKPPVDMDQVLIDEGRRIQEKDVKKRNERKVQVNYQVELENALNCEDYEEAGIIRDIIAGTKTADDLKTYRSGKKKI